MEEGWRAQAVQRARSLFRALKRVVPFAMVAFVVFEWNGIPGQPLRDTVAYHEAAQAARATGDLYASVEGVGPHDGRWHYLYPPPLAALLSLLPEMSYRTLDRAWLVLNLFAFWTFAAVLGRIRRGRWSLDGTLTWGAGLFLVPGSLLAIHFGNIEPVLWAIIGLAFVLSQAKGFLLATAAAVKITPGWALLAFALRRPRRTLIPALAAGGALTAICAWVFGVELTWDLLVDWRERVVPTLAQGQYWGSSLANLRSGPGLVGVFENLSLSFAPVQLAILAGWDYGGGELPELVRGYLTTVALGVPLLVLWLTRSRSPSRQAAFTLVAAALAAPIVRSYVLPLALLPLALVLRDRAESRTADR